MMKILLAKVLGTFYHRKTPDHEFRRNSLSGLFKIYILFQLEEGKKKV